MRRSYPSLSPVDEGTIGITMKNCSVWPDNNGIHINAYDEWHALLLSAWGGDLRAVATNAISRTWICDLGGHAASQE